MISATLIAKFTPLPLVELYVELQADEAEISQAYSYNILISTLSMTVLAFARAVAFAAVRGRREPGLRRRRGDDGAAAGRNFTHC